jgi:hypothetical protein
MRSNAFIQTLVPAVFGLGFIVFGVAAFIRVQSSERKYEGELQSIRANNLKPDTLTVVGKYIDPGRGAWPHVVFGGNRLARVDVAATGDFFNSVNLGDEVPGYYFPDGYFIPRNHRSAAGSGKWFIPCLGALLGLGVLSFAFAKARLKAPDVDMDALRTIARERKDGH